MTNAGMFNEPKLEVKVKNLKARIKGLMEINKDHQIINGKLRSELSIEQKNHDLVKEEVEILNLELKLKDKEIGRMMKKLSK
jgi:regulator of replication initiation timing